MFNIFKKSKKKKRKMYSQIMVLMREGKNEELVETLEEFLRDYPNEVETYELIYWACLLLRKYDEALKILDDVLEVKSDWELYFKKGELLRHPYFKRYDEAYEYFDMACAKKPNYVEALLNKGKMLRERGREKEGEGCVLEALRLLDEAKKIEHEKGRFHLLAAWCYEYLKNFEEAEKCFDMGMKVQPENLMIDAERANMRLRMGDYNGARTVCQRILKISEDKGILDIIHVTIARCYLAGDDMESALRHFNTALRINPYAVRFVDSHEELKILLEESEKCDDGEISGDKDQKAVIERD